MKLELATKQYIKANRSKGAAQLISAAKKAIDAGRRSKRNKEVASKKE